MPQQKRLSRRLWRRSRHLPHRSGLRFSYSHPIPLPLLSLLPQARTAVRDIHAGIASFSAAMVLKVLRVTPSDTRSTCDSASAAFTCTNTRVLPPASIAVGAVRRRICSRPRHSRRSSSRLRNSRNSGPSKWSNPSAEKTARGPGMHDSRRQNCDIELITAVATVRRVPLAFAFIYSSHAHTSTMPIVCATRRICCGVCGARCSSSSALDRTLAMIAAN